MLRVTGKTAETTSEYISTQENEAEPSNNRKPRYKSYTGAVVNEEVVKLTEKVVVPVKEYPKVSNVSVYCIKILEFIDIDLKMFFFNSI